MFTDLSFLNTIPETFSYDGIMFRHHFIDDNLARLEDGWKI